MPATNNQAPIAQNDGNFAQNIDLQMGNNMGQMLQRPAQLTQQQQHQLAMERKQHEAQRQQKLMSMQQANQQQQIARSTPISQRVPASPSMQQASGNNGGIMMNQVCNSD